MPEKAAGKLRLFHKNCGKVVENPTISNVNLMKFLKIRLFAQNLGSEANLFILNELINY